ncbi:MAG: RNA-binding cell elongation regulator Jag/EloR [Thermodesulfobacteriota bacterium]
MAVVQEYTGKNVEEAIRIACESLSCDREQLDIEVLAVGSAGIFGFGLKKARVRVTLRGVAERGETVADVDGEEAGDDGGDGREEPGGVAERPEMSPEIIAEAERQLQVLLEKMGLSVTARVEAGGNGLDARIEGEDLATLTGEDGMVLDSLQYLLRKMLSKQFRRRIVITVDAGEYRASRRQELENMAVTLATEVKETGESRTIAALNPAERRIIHMAIQDDTAVRSRSIGDGLFKKIVIYQPGKKIRRSGSSAPRGRRVRT